MDRLTMPDEPIEGGMRRSVVDARVVKEQAMGIYWKLKAYEDTGLEPVEKIKVTSTEIVVHGTIDKPYYEIKYREIGSSEYHVGYSSYDLNNVFEWLKECFEIVNTDEQQN